MDKLIVILGPTASGKSSLAVKLALRLRSGQAKKEVEIVSADSRQVYKGLDIGSGKITKKEMMGIPHHLLDVASPHRKFTVAQFQKIAHKTIPKIHARGRVPFLVGGTGFYIQATVENLSLPKVRPSRALRARLSKKSAAELFIMLKKLDPARAKTIDAKNPHRLMRAIEIVKVTGEPVPPQQSHKFSDVLEIGIKKSPEELKKAIHKRLLKRLPGMIVEVKKLRRGGLPWKRLEELGLEYKYTAQYLQGKLIQEEMIAKIQKESEHFAKRQMTWFKRDKRIHWIKNKVEAEKLIKHFLK